MEIIKHNRPEKNDNNKEDSLIYSLKRKNQIAWSCLICKQVFFSEVGIFDHLKLEHKIKFNRADLVSIKARRGKPKPDKKPYQGSPPNWSARYGLNHPRTPLFRIFFERSSQE